MIYLYLLIYLLHNVFAILYIFLWYFIMVAERAQCAANEKPHTIEKIHLQIKKTSSV